MARCTNCNTHFVQVPEKVVLDHLCKWCELTNAKATIEAVEQIINRPTASDCHCTNCEKYKELNKFFFCITCGFQGKPATVLCTCYKYRCSGVVPNYGVSRGLGCCHGDLNCPVCQSGNADVCNWDTIREIRRVLSTVPKVEIDKTHLLNTKIRLLQRVIEDIREDTVLDRQDVEYYKRLIVVYRAWCKDALEEVGFCEKQNNKKS